MQKVFELLITDIVVGGLGEVVMMPEDYSPAPQTTVY